MSYHQPIVALTSQPRISLASCNQKFSRVFMQSARSKTMVSHSGCSLSAKITMNIVPFNQITQKFNPSDSSDVGDNTEKMAV